MAGPGTEPLPKLTLMPISIFSRIVCLFVALILLVNAPARGQNATGVSSSGEPRTGSSDPEFRVKVIGDADELFFVLMSSTEDPKDAGKRLESSAVFARGTGDSKWTWLGVFAGFTSDLAVWRNQLVLLQADGTWRSAYVGGSSSGVPVRDGTLLRLAAQGDALFGLVAQPGVFRLVRLEAGAWRELGELPAPPNLGPVTTGTVELAVMNDVATVAMVADGGEVMVAVSSTLPPSLSTTLPSTRTTSPATSPATAPVTWASRPPFTPRKPAESLRLFPLGNSVALWVNPGLSSGGDVYLDERLDDSPSAERARRTPPSFSLGADGGEAAVSGGRVRLFYSPKSGGVRPPSSSTEPEIFERVFDATGEQLGEPGRVVLPLGPSNEDRLSVAVGAFAFGGLFLAVLLSWRRRSETPVAVLEGAFRLPLASRTKRLLAGLIDCSPLVLVTAYLVSTNTTMASEFVLTPKVVFTELVAIAVVVTHTCLSELIAGKTLGKAVFGLRVTDLTGKTAHPSRILLRNCFKAVDLLLLLPLVSILISPLRQSVGDSASATLVLETPPVSPSDAPLPPSPPRE